jgi:dTDP-glucose 4,6-dehydratase
MKTTNHILLTGGTGFFGKALLRYWIAIESTGKSIGQVTLLSRNPKKFAAEYPELVTHHWLHLIQGDVCDSASLPKGQSFTHVLHAATESTAGPLLTPMQRFDQIVNGTRNILDLAVASGASRFLLTSSGGVYGPQPPDLEHIVEEYQGMPDPLNPNNSYSVAKRCAEHLCALYQDQHGLETVIARCFAFVGQDLPLDVHFAIGNFIRDALTSPEINVNGDGTPVRSYMDQRDLAQWLCVLLEEGVAGQAYNVGSDQSLTIRELANLIRDLLAPEKLVKIACDTGVEGYRNRYVPEIKKTQSELGLKITHKLTEAILTVANHHVTTTSQCK